MLIERLVESDEPDDIHADDGCDFQYDFSSEHNQRAEHDFSSEYDQRADDGWRLLHS